MCSAHMYMPIFVLGFRPDYRKTLWISQLVSAGAKLPVTYREPGLCRDHYRDRGSVHHHPSTRHYHAHGAL